MLVASTTNINNNIPPPTSKMSASQRKVEMEGMREERLTILRGLDDTITYYPENTSLISSLEKAYYEYERQEEKYLMDIVEGHLLYCPIAKKEDMILELERELNELDNLVPSSRECDLELFEMEEEGYSKEAIAERRKFIDETFDKMREITLQIHALQDELEQLIKDSNPVA